MKITIFNGSPKAEKSNTNIICQAFAKGAQKAGADIETIHLINHNIKHCTGCFSCWTKTAGKCVIRDDMDSLINLYLESDIAIFATPVYLWNMTACLKNFADRLIPTLSKNAVEDSGNYDMKRREIKIPKKIIISNAGFPGDNNFETMKAVMKSAKPILEIYRNCGMLLQIDSPAIKNKVNDYLTVVEKAGQEIVENGEVSQGILNRLEMELISTEKYMEIINS